MYVGDGTWDSTRNNFLLPNLVGLNFETMQYNGIYPLLYVRKDMLIFFLGMGNRFKTMPGYHSLIRAHGIIAVIAFLILLPAAILMAQFYSRNPFWALRMHIYLQILVVGLSTVVFITGFNAVGLNRSLTNPHHGIGVAIYTLILVQAIGGWWIHKREKKRIPVKLPVKLVLHQWLGRTIALLGFAQVPLGLTLYGSPKWMFILYAVWMFFLLVLFFVLCYRAIPPLDGYVGGSRRSRSHGGTVISDKKPSRFGGLLGPLALGAGAAALLGRRNRSRSRSRSHSRSRRTEVIPSRRGSGSYIEEEKYSERPKKSGGMMDKLLKAGAVFGAVGLAKSFFGRKKGRRDDDDYSSVAHDTPSRRHAARRHSDSDLSESIVVHRMEEGRPGHSGVLPGPGDPVLAAAAISAAAPRPTTPRPVRRQSSFDSSSYYYDSTLSPSRRPQSTHKARNGVLAGLGLGWFAKKMKDRRDRKEMDRLDRLEAQRIEDERLARHGATPSRLTGDGFPNSGRRHQRRPSIAHSSELSSIIDDPHTIRPGAIPPPIVPPPFQPGPIATDMEARRSRYDVTQPVAMPPLPHDPQGILHQEESGSEAYMSAGGHPHRRHSSRRRREGEIAAAAAVAEAASLAAKEEARRRRSRSRGGHTSADVVSPPVSVKVKVHGDKDRNVTLRRLTEQEAAAEREARRSDRRRRRADSLSSLSGTDTGPSRRRYRREGSVRRDNTPPPAMAPLNPPAPPFAGGRKPKDSAYYSGRPSEPGGSPAGLPAGSIGSPESHGTWSAMSPSVEGGDGAEAAAERRRRRRLERNQRNQTGTVDFT